MVLKPSKDSSLGEGGAGRASQGNCAGFCEQIIPRKIRTQEVKPDSGLNKLSFAQNSATGYLENSEVNPFSDPGLI